VDVITEGSNFASVFGVPPLFLNFPSKEVWYFCLCLYVHILCSTCSAALWRRLRWCKLTVVVMSLCEIVHILFLYLMFLLASIPYIGTYLLSKNSWFSLWRIIFCYWSQSTLKIWVSNFVVVVVVVVIVFIVFVVVIFFFQVKVLTWF